MKAQVQTDSKLWSKLWALMVMSALVMVVAPALAAVDAVAAEPYVFGGTCSSRGDWTRKALVQTSNIRSALLQLKNNPACTGMRESIDASLMAMQEKLSEASSGEKIAPSSQSSFGEDIRALRSFARESSSFQDVAKRLLLGRSFDKHATEALRTTNGNQNNDQAERLQSLKDRARASAREGLSYFNLTVSSFANAKEGCLDDAQTGAVISGLVQTLSSFAGGRDDALGTEFSRALANLLDLSRQDKYITALRKLNDRQFISSMSCLLEATAENYCTALDGRYLLEEIVQSHNIKKVTVFNKHTQKNEDLVVGESENFRKAHAKGPLAGYFIISRQLQVVNDWIQKLQYGITPQLPTEATFQTDVITSVVDLMKTIKKIQGSFNQRKEFLRNPKLDKKAKQDALKNMVLETAGEMGVGHASNALNFFQQAAGGSNELFFKLLDIDVPDAVRGRGAVQESALANNPAAWLQIRFSELPQFQSPESYVFVVERKMEEIFQRARQFADAYYTQYFIVDKIQLINDSLLGMDTNVRDALAHIDMYLADLYTRVEKSKRDVTILPSIRQTRLRINHVLARYKALRDLGLDSSNSKLSQKELDTKLRSIGEELIKEVYGQFDVMMARAGWLSNRMVGFVLYDYTMTVRNRDQLDPYLNDLFIASGYDVLRDMFQMSSVSYSRAKTDLDIALNVNRENVAALEDVVEDVFVRHIVKLDREAKGEELTFSDLSARAPSDGFASQLEQSPGENAGLHQRALRAYWQAFKMVFLRQDADKYGQPSLIDEAKGMFENDFGRRIVRTQISSPFDSSETEKALLCAQALSFPNLGPYWYFCKSSVLRSPLLKENMPEGELKKLALEYLSIPVEQKAWEGIPNRDARSATKQQRSMNYAKRICALRDYHRRNEVARVSAAMSLDGSDYKSPFMEHAEKMIAEVTAETRAQEQTAKALTTAAPVSPPVKGEKAKDSKKVSPSAVPAKP